MASTTRKSSSSRPARAAKRKSEPQARRAKGNAPAPRPSSSASSSNVERLSTDSTASEVVPATAGRVLPDLSPSRNGAAPSEGRGVGKYVYCIISTDKLQHFGRIGLGEQPSEVATINYKNLAAVVSDTPLTVHDPTRENVLAHQTVNETVMKKYTVLPMSFGTVFKTADDIVELLRSAYEAFRDVLDKMQDKVEFGLKVLWDRDAVVREIEKDEEEVQRLKAEISNAKGSTYFARMQYGRLIDAQMQGRSERYVAEIFQALRDVSVASRSNKPIGDKMILNAAFLVSRDREAAFDALVREIGSRYADLTFKYTGPWPPYNFVNIRLKLERAK